MRAPGTITLFSVQSDNGRGASSFLVSFFFHAGASALIWLGLMYPPVVVTPISARHYLIRHLDLQSPSHQARQAAGSSVYYPGPLPAARSHAPGGRPALHPPILRDTVKMARGPQTLIQEDLRSHLVLKHLVPVPAVVIWTPTRIPVKTIVAPLPVQPTAAAVTPSLQPPNEEVNQADLELASSQLPSQKLKVFSSTTSPVVVQAPKQAQTAPATAVQNAAKPSPATVISLSDLTMPNGVVTLPPVNETDLKAVPGPAVPGQTQDLSRSGRGNPSSTAGGVGPGLAPGTPSGVQSASGAAGTPNGASSGMAVGSANGAGTGELPTVDHITLPRDGQFGSVIIGDSLVDEFPEIVNAWGGRVAYTVYLHVGLARSWILQYSLPPDASAAAAGEINRLQAPWPYNIVRPNLAPGSIDADALLIHGFVNRAGRFESLSVAFPPNFPQAQFVLNSLAQWQFRPASENGQVVRVEVLLIIPEDFQ
ncbi:MAG TPA: hypothetical protein VMA34_21415 [Terracidiphilus sp.]|nr:hypothetical protein [Terracidiphilus sp.]